MKRFFAFYGKSWKNCFDTVSPASAGEYWSFVSVWLLQAGLTAFSFALTQKRGGTLLPFYSLLGLLVLASLPFVTLTLRRLRAVKRSGSWALLLLLIGVGTLAVLLLCSGVFLAAKSNCSPAVYGPPEWFNPSANKNGDVYGPPEWLDRGKGDRKP